MNIPLEGLLNFKSDVVFIFLKIEQIWNADEIIVSNYYIPVLTYSTHCEHFIGFKDSK